MNEIIAIFMLISFLSISAAAELPTIWDETLQYHIHGMLTASTMILMPILGCNARFCNTNSAQS